MNYSPIKWVGGKARLVTSLMELLPPDVEDRRHVELFAGGASLFFARRPQEALLADANYQLMGMYRALKGSVGDVLRELNQHSHQHGEAYYYRVRDRFNQQQGNQVVRAAMFLYMNRVCYNGLWRVNKSGGYNVPFGKYENPKIIDEPRLRAAASALRKATFGATGYAGEIRDITKHDFVYLDPPYAPVRNDSFRSYAVAGFSMDDHVMLRNAFASMDRKGAKVMLSNSDTPAVRDLYKDFRIGTVQTPRSVSRRSEQRGRVTELIVRNY